MISGRNLTLIGYVAFAMLIASKAQADSVPPVSFSRQVLPLLQQRCVSCHNSDDPMGGLSVSPDVAYQQLVRSPSAQSPQLRVKPGQPDESYLIAKLTGRQFAAGGRGFSMPIGFSPTTPRQLEIFRHWIKQGAPRN